MIIVFIIIAFIAGWIMNCAFMVADMADKTSRLRHKMRTWAGFIFLGAMALLLMDFGVLSYCIFTGKYLG